MGITNFRDLMLAGGAAIAATGALFATFYFVSNAYLIPVEDIDDWVAIRGSAEEKMLVLISAQETAERSVSLTEANKDLTEELSTVKGQLGEAERELERVRESTVSAREHATALARVEALESEKEAISEKLETLTKTFDTLTAGVVEKGHQIVLSTGKSQTFQIHDRQYGRDISFNLAVLHVDRQGCGFALSRNDTFDGQLHNGYGSVGLAVNMDISLYSMRLASVLHEEDRPYCLFRLEWR